MVGEPVRLDLVTTSSSVPRAWKPHMQVTSSSIATLLSSPADRSICQAFAEGPGPKVRMVYGVRG